MSDDETPVPEDGASESSEDSAAEGGDSEGTESGANEDKENLADEWASAMEESGDMPGIDPDSILAELEAGEAEAGIAPVALDPVSDDSQPHSGNGDNPELEVILDIPVRISMEVGCTQIPIRNLLQLNQGSVVELDRLAGEPLDVMVNGTLIAHGEVVMVNDKFGIRLTDVVSQTERIQRLK